MLLVILPHLARARDESIRQLALTTMRVISIASLLTVVAGFVLIAWTRGYGFLLVGEWGGIVMSSLVLAIVLGAIGDAGLRPALRRLNPEAADGLTAARRWTIAGISVGIVILLLMTRAIYAR